MNQDKLRKLLDTEFLLSSFCTQDGGGSIKYNPSTMEFIVDDGDEIIKTGDSEFAAISFTRLQNKYNLI